MYWQDEYYDDEDDYCCCGDCGEPYEDCQCEWYEAEGTVQSERLNLGDLGIQYGTFGNPDSLDELPF